MQAKRKPTKKPTRITAEKVNHNLELHEIQCAERWKTAFNHFEKLDEDINSLNSWIKGGLTMVVISMFGIFITNLFL
tara:strand:+ start:1002 stop:1232 length:231 start_codon:yes stop_codon:yes gene_type:complete